jgi:hypothetical protein
MSLALAAELNGYPGPRHTIELASELGLTPDQSALQYNQLLSQRGILCFKSALGLEERGNQVQEEEYQRDHCRRR